LTYRPTQMSKKEVHNMGLIVSRQSIVGACALLDRLASADLPPEKMPYWFYIFLEGVWKIG